MKLPKAWRKEPLNSRRSVDSHRNIKHSGEWRRESLERVLGWLQQLPFIFPMCLSTFGRGKRGGGGELQGSCTIQEPQPSVATEPLKELVSAELCRKCQIHTRFRGKPAMTPVTLELVRIKSSRSFLAAYWVQNQSRLQETLPKERTKI